MTRGDTALALAVKRRQWELLAWYVLLGVAETARKLPPGTIHDVLAVLAREDERDGAAD
jgi:hypothetical protein